MARSKKPADPNAAPPKAVKPRGGVPKVDDENSWVRKSIRAELDRWKATATPAPEAKPAAVEAPSSELPKTEPAAPAPEALPKKRYTFDPLDLITED